jgi:hypothetical protein
VGVLGGAWLHECHIRIRDKYRRRTEQIVRERDVQEFVELSPNLATALIGGAQDESREELMELWARLLIDAHIADNRADEGNDAVRLVDLRRR